ncbi:MAG TPA: serine hydrolase domain-containing protein [Acidobacteriota bacterium]|nr:serine hydrolase domain-containing protein [Acidobacteriota bacterium]
MLRSFPAHRPLALAALLGTLALSSTALAQHLPAAVPEAVGVSSARLDRLSRVLQGYVDNGQVAGIVALLTRRGKVVYHEAIGQRDVAANAPMQHDTIFRIASQSKAVTSVAAMILVEEGLMLLSDPVGKYLPAFADTIVAVANGNGYDVVPTDRPITVRDLLTHSTGVSYGDGPAVTAYKDAGIYGWYFADKDEPIGVTVDRLAALPFNAHPGDEWIYGYSSDILGALIEQVSGTDLDSFFQEKILDPLAMSDTHFYLPPAKRDRLATVYAATPEGGIVRSPDVGDGMLVQGAYVDGPRKSFSGGAGLLSTASDYARFLQMLLAGGALDGERLLSPKTVELMTVNHVADRFAWGAGAGFGLGFQITLDLGATGQHGSDGAYSWGGAYHTTYWVDPDEDLVAVLMTQLIPAGNSDLHAKFETMVYQAIVR